MKGPGRNLMSAFLPDLDAAVRSDWRDDFEPWPETPPRVQSPITPVEVDWRLDAACRDTDPTLFFPEKGDNARAQAAKAVCAGCAVRDACLAEALTGREKFGIWGGVSEKERRALRPKRRAA